MIKKNQLLGNTIEHLNKNDESTLDEIEIWSIFEKGELIEMDKYGRKIYNGQCKVCHKFFENHRSFYSHGKRCILKKRDKIRNHNINEYVSSNKNSSEIPGIETTCETITGSCLSDDQIALVNAICHLNMPISTLGKSEWQGLISALGARSQTPCPAKIRGLVVAYASEIRMKIDNELSGKHVTVITDGGTLGDRTIYNVVFFSEKKLYFGGLLRVQISDHETLAKELQNPIKRIEKKEAVIIAIITDNAKNLSLATTSSAQNPRFTKNQITCIQELTRLPIFHVPCGIHTINLVISDYEKKSKDFSSFKIGITEYFRKLHSKPVKNVLRQAGITRKIPIIEEIKWRTYVEAFGFLETELDKIKECTSRNPEIFKELIFRDEWLDYLKVLKPLGVFETIVQDNNVYLSEYYQYYIKMINDIELMKTAESIEFKSLISQRMKNSGLECLSHLSFILSRIDIKSVKSEFHSLFSWNMIDISNPKRTELQTKYEELTRKLVELSQFWKVSDASRVIPIMFELFLKNMGESSTTTEAYYRSLSTKHVFINGLGNVSCQGFAIVALRISQLPASEAVCERVFSHLANLFPPSRWSTNDNFMDAQMTVRMQGIFDKSNQMQEAF